MVYGDDNHYCIYNKQDEEAKMSYARKSTSGDGCTKLVYIIWRVLAVLLSLSVSKYVGK